MKIRPYNGAYLATAIVCGFPLLVINNCRSECVQQALETAYRLYKANKKAPN